jgi:hypothetical protein
MELDGAVEFRMAEPHVLVRKYDENTGQLYLMCSRCGLAPRLEEAN